MPLRYFFQKKITKQNVIFDIRLLKNKRCKLFDLIWLNEDQYNKKKVDTKIVKIH